MNDYSTKSDYSGDNINEICQNSVNNENSDFIDLSSKKEQLQYGKNLLILIKYLLPTVQASIKPNLNGSTIKNNHYSTNEQMISNKIDEDRKNFNGIHSKSSAAIKTTATVEVDSDPPNSGQDLRWKNSSTKSSSTDFNTTIITNGILDSGKCDNLDSDYFSSRKITLSRSNFYSTSTAAATVVTSNTSTSERRLLQNNNSNNTNSNLHSRNFHTLNYNQFKVVPTLYSTFLIPSLYSLNSLINSNNLTSQDYCKYQNIKNNVQLSNEQSIADQNRKDSNHSKEFHLITDKTATILSPNELKTAIKTKTTTITKTNNTNHQQNSSLNQPPLRANIDPLVFPASNGIFNRNDQISTNIGKDFFTYLSASLFSTASFGGGGGGGDTADYLNDDVNQQQETFHLNDIDIDNNNDEDNDLLSSLLDEEYSIEDRGELNYPNIFSRPQFRHLTLADKHRLERLFKEIDVDGNGVIDFNDLLQTLEQKGIQATHENVKHLILRSDSNLDGDIDFAEFVSYCLENEKQLHIIFKDIDVNDDGKIDANELVLAFERAGIKVDQQEALRLVKRIKTNPKNRNSKNADNTTLELDYNEFRDYLLLHPTDSLQDLMRSWRFGTFVELSEDGIMPVDFSENEIKTGMWWRHMLAGGIAGAVSRTSTAPLDRLKVFLQVRGAEFNGLGVCLKHMIQEGGVLSLWRGNGINVLKIAPETALKFMAFDQLKRLLHSGGPNSEINIIERFVAGSLAGAVSQTVIYPMEVLKTRFCLRQTGQYRGLWDAAYKIYSNGGIKNFYRGYVPNLIGIIPYAGIDLTIYETLKKMYMKSHSLEEAPVYVCLTCGTVSSTFGQIASYPLALIRTRMQSEIGHHSSSMIDMFRTTVKNEGIRGLYRGITANIMKVAPAVSISYVVYEYTRRPLGAIMS